VNTFTRRLTVIYGEPDSIDPKAYLDEIEHLTAGYGNNVLNEAADAIIGGHRFKSWPTPAQCLNACQMAAERLAAKQPEKRLYRFPSKMGPYDPETVATWELATAWRNSLPDSHPLVKQSAGVRQWAAKICRDAFAQMQRNSPNQGLHRTDGGLSTMSKRMQGDDA
jgi:hypothetical protein